MYKFKSQQDISDAIANLSSPGICEIPGLEPAGWAVEGIVPEKYHGGFAIVYPVRDKRMKYSLRVPIVPVDDIEYRIKEVSEYLERHPSTYFSNKYRYIKKGLKVGDGVADIIIQNWIEGETLFDYINYKIDNFNEIESKSIFKSLASSAKAMFRWLHLNKISHGDIQHNNVLVRKDSNALALCDYDSVTIPSLDGQPRITNGLPGYQHPCISSTKKTTLKNDYFSEIILYSGLLVLSINPKLWNHDNKDEDFFLIPSSEFDDIKYGRPSPIYDELCQLTPNTHDEEAVISEIRALMRLLKENLECDDLESINPIPGLSNTYCTYCGHSIEEEYNFCPYCGTKTNKLKTNENRS